MIIDNNIFEVYSIIIITITIAIISSIFNSISTLMSNNIIIIIHNQHRTYEHADQWEHQPQAISKTDK